MQALPYQYSQCGLAKLSPNDTQFLFGRSFYGLSALSLPSVDPSVDFVRGSEGWKVRYAKSAEKAIFEQNCPWPAILQPSHTHKDDFDGVTTFFITTMRLQLLKQVTRSHNMTH